MHFKIYKIEIEKKKNKRWKLTYLAVAKFNHIALNSENEWSSIVFLEQLSWIPLEIILIYSLKEFFSPQRNDLSPINVISQTLLSLTKLIFYLFRMPFYLLTFLNITHPFNSHELISYNVLLLVLKNWNRTIRKSVQRYQ